MFARPAVSIWRRHALAWIALCLVSLAVAACGATAGGSTGGTPVSTTPPTQAVSLATDHASYSPTTSIVVTITNRRQASVYSMDHQSLCAIVTLELQINGAWVTQRPCKLMIATRIVEVAPGTTQITLAPGDTPWPVGAYRLVFHYGVSKGDDMSGLAVESAQFTVA